MLRLLYSPECVEWRVTAGLDLGDKYSYLCLLDTDGGEVIEEGRVRTTPEALRRHFSRAAYARGPRGRESLALGKSAARGVLSRGAAGGQRPQTAAYLRQQAQQR